LSLLYLYDFEFRHYVNHQVSKESRDRRINSTPIYLASTCNAEASWYISRNLNTGTRGTQGRPNVIAVKVYSAWKGSPGRVHAGTNTESFSERKSRVGKLRPVCRERVSTRKLLLEIKFSKCKSWS